MDSDQDGCIVLGKHMATRKYQMSLSCGHPLVPFYVGCCIVDTYRGDVYELSMKKASSDIGEVKEPFFGVSEDNSA